MLVIELTFLSGRFHATPWGRHVNEGVPEWPPSPYRLVRVLYDTWKRKQPDWPESRVRPLLEALAGQPPMFHLPPAGASHTRAFLSENTRSQADKKLIFDAFVSLSPGAGVLVGWPDLCLTEDQTGDLSQLLALVNFFGRSESWVSARVLDCTQDIDWNAVPAELAPAAGRWESVRVACLVSPSGFKAGDWMEAITWSTDDVIKKRRSEPPALRYVDYVRPASCFDLPPVRRPARREPAVNAVLYALESKVRPRVTETLEIAERVRSKLMGIHKRLAGDPAHVSSKFSGKDAEGRPLSGHQHVFILPLDKDQDGWLDHLVVCSKEPFDRDERLALDRLESLWQADGKPDIRLLPLCWATLEQLFPPKSHIFVSATPFVPPRHYRKGRGDFNEWLAEEVRREAAYHGLPPPLSITPVPRLVRRGRSLHWLEFRRNRKGDTITIGYGFRLKFPEPVAGPVALGYGCHFGLGQFEPVRN